MRNITFHVKQTDDGYWTYIQKSPGDLAIGQPLYAVLQWIVEQLNFQMCRTETDEDGDIATLIIGEGASRHFASMENAEKQASGDLLRVNVASVLANAREQGTEPEHVALVEQATITRTAWAELNTEFHYAFQLVEVLKRLRGATFNYSPPGIHGRAPLEVVYYLREATRCFLYGLLEASVALCRACLEEALKTKLYTSAQGIEMLMKEPKKNDRGRPRGDLERLISAAAGIQLLDGPSRILADRIRNHGNTVMH